MSTFMRLSAAAASVFLICAVLGFELGAAAQADNDNTAHSTTPSVVSPGAGSLKNIKTRSIAGFQTAAIRTSSVWSSAYPAANPIGPAAGNVRAARPRLRSMPSACLVAMN